jgi:hypothetical protein
VHALAKKLGIKKIKLACAEARGDSPPKTTDLVCQYRPMFSVKTADDTVGLFLDPPEKANDVILRIGVHCAKVPDRLLRSLPLTEVQLDELWSFVKKKKVMNLLKTTRTPKMIILRKRTLKKN